MNNPISGTALDNPIVVLALLLAGGFLAFCLIRFLTKTSKNRRPTQKNSSRQHITNKAAAAKQTAQKDEAIARFREVHQRARDNRKKLAQEIDTNPAEATKAFRRMMKH